MSTRKENITNKTSASNNTGGKRHVVTHRGKCTPINLNSTFANIVPASNRAKPEFRTTFMHTPSINYDLQIDIASSNYFQALAFREYTSNQKHKQHTLSFNDQLSKYTDILSEKLETMHELELNIKEQEIQNMVRELMLRLEDKLERNLKELSPEIVSRFVKILQKLEYACNHLYLDNVKMLQDQDEFHKLQVLLSNCSKILSKVINVSGDIAKYQDLNKLATNIKSTQKEISMIENSVKTLQGDVNKLTLETISDVLFENNNVILKNNIIDL